MSANELTPGQVGAALRAVVAKMYVESERRKLVGAELELSGGMLRVRSQGEPPVDGPWAQDRIDMEQLLTMADDELGYWFDDLLRPRR